MASFLDTAFPDWNPLDIASGLGNAFGGALDDINPLGINLGIGAVPRFIGNFVPGMAHLGAAGALEAYGALSGTNQSKASNYLEQAKTGLGHSFQDTATDVLDLGGLAPWAAPLKHFEGSRTGYTPRDLYDKATSPGEGLGGGLVNDAMNVAIVADAAGRVAGAGTVGHLASDANDAAKLAERDTTGATTPDSARQSSIELASRDQAAKEGFSGDNLDARAQDLTDAALRRAKHLEIIDKFRHPLGSVFHDVLRQPGRAIKAGEFGGAQATTDIPPGTEQTPAVPPGEPAPTIAPQEALGRVPTPGPDELTVWHGQRAENAGSEPGPWFHADRGYAEKQAGPGGRVYATTMPRDVYEAMAKQTATRSGEVGTELGPARAATAVHVGGGADAIDLAPAKTVAEHAAAYKEANGFADHGRPVPASLEVNPEFHRDVAKAYDEMKNEPGHPRVRAAYQALLHETGQQFHFMTEDPNGPHLQVEFVDREHNPYGAGGADAPEMHRRMLEDVQSNNHLYVDKTQPGETHPVMTPEENDIFRAVHDYFGHAAAGNNFGRAGEEIAYRLHSQMFSPAAREALATETRGQNSWLNYSEHNDVRRAAGDQAEFPVQKAGILPAEYRDEYPLLPRRKSEIPTKTELKARIQAERPVPDWAKKIAPIVPPGLRAVAKFIDTLAINRETTAILRENTRLIRGAAAGARLSPVVVEAVKVSTDHLVQGGMSPADANVAVGARAVAIAALGPLYDELQAKVDNGTIPPELANRALTAALGASWPEIPPELDTPDFRARMTALASLYSDAKLAAEQQLHEDTRQGDRGLEPSVTQSGTPDLTKRDQGRLDLVGNLVAKANELEASQAPLERLQYQADILQGRDRIGALGAERQAALADQEQAIADFDRARMPLAMRSDRVWGQAVDAIVAQTLDPEGFGGATFSQHTNEFVTAEGGATYSVGVLPDTALVVPLTGVSVVDAERLAKGVDEVGHRYQDLLRDPDTVLGTWTADGVVHIDVSQTTIGGRPLTADQADIFASARGQQATWDFQNATERHPLLPQDLAIDLASTDMRQLGRVMTQLRNVIDQINGATDPRATARRPDALISAAEADAHAVLLQRDAVMAFRNNPGRWTDADKVFGGLDIKYLSPGKASRLAPEALFQRVILDKGFTMADWDEAKKAVANVDEARVWYSRVHNEVNQRLQYQDGTIPTVTLGDGRAVPMTDLFFNVLALTSTNATVRENLGFTLRTLANYGSFLDQMGKNKDAVMAVFDQYAAERAAGKEIGATELYDRLVKNVPTFDKSVRWPLLEILSGHTIDRWGEPVSEMPPEWHQQYQSTVAELRASSYGQAIEKLHPGIFDQLGQAPGEIASHVDTVEQIRAAWKQAVKDGLPGSKDKSYGAFKKALDRIGIMGNQADRLPRGDVPYIEARQAALGNMPNQISYEEALKHIDPSIVDRIGPDRAVMEYWGQASWAKIRSFVENLAHPENVDAVTMDQHTARYIGIPEEQLRKPGEYLRAAMEHRDLRDLLAKAEGNPDLTNNDVQALFWAHSKILQAAGRGDIAGLADWADYAHTWDDSTPLISGARADFEAGMGREVFWQRFQNRVLGAFVPGSNAQRAFMGFTRDANIGTLIHESGHWMRTLLGPEDMDLLERSYGVKDGAWKAGHEERFAEDLMRYFEAGHGPVELTTVFQKIRNWLGGAWRLITRNGAADDIAPEVRQVLDGWFHPEREAGPIDLSPTLPMPKDDPGTLAQRARRVPQSAKFESPAQAAKRGAEQQAALDDFSAAVKRQRDAEIATKKAQASVAKLEKRVQQPMRAEVMAQALRGRATTLAGKVEESLRNPSAARTPPAWQPVLRAANEIAKMVEEHPELEPALADLPRTFGDAFDRLDAAGFNPTHMSDWSTSKVRSLAYGTARLGLADRGVGTEVVATSRKARSGYLAQRELANRSIEAIAAMIAEPMQEARSNHVVDFMERNWAQRIAPGTEVPTGMTLWAPVKRGLLGIETPAGETQAVGEQLVIPTEVARGLKRYSAPGVDNPMLRALQRVQSPWKAALLTWSPKFYLNHILGHVVLGSLAGATRLGDWVNAWHEMRSGFANMPEVTAQSLVQAELGSTAFVEYPSLRSAKDDAGMLEATRQVSRNLHRVVNVADSFARAAVVMADVRKGATIEDALQHAAEALVDYNDLNSLERSAVKAIIPFYGFQKGVLKLVARLPLDQPIAAGMIMQIGMLNEKWAVDANGNPLPDAYSGILQVPGIGSVDTKPINPLKDAESLVTPEGIMGSLHPIVKLMVDAAVGAPQLHVDSSGRIVANRGQTFHTGPTGAPVADINPGEELKSLFETTPQVAALGSGIGAGSQPGIKGVASAFLPTRNDETITRAADRAKSTSLALPKYGPEQAAKAYAKFLANQPSSGPQTVSGTTGTTDASAGLLPTFTPASGGLTQRGRMLQAAYSNRGGHYGIRKSRRRYGAKRKRTVKLGSRLTTSRKGIL